MKRETVTINAVGDICPGDHYFSMGHGVSAFANVHGVESLFAGVSAKLRNADIVFGNLEGVLSQQSSQKSAVQRAAFRGDPKQAPGLRASGFNCLNVANNHALQHGMAAFNDTVAALAASGIQVLGLTDRSRTRPVFFSCAGITVCLLGYSWVPERYVSGAAPYATSSLSDIVHDIAAYRAKADIVVVSIHAGIEGTRIPDAGVVNAFRALVDQGADIVLGHHAHVFQPVERYKGRLIFYGLGNFLFDLFWRAEYVQGAIARVTIDAATKEIDYELLPVRFDPKPLRLVPMNLPESQRWIGQLTARAQVMHQTHRSETEPSMGAAKLAYFAKNYFKGATGLKTKFLLEKVFG